MNELKLKKNKLSDEKRKSLSYFKYRKSILNEKIRKRRKEKHNKFIKDNKKVVISLDVLFGLIILFNLGALLITNTLVIKDDPSKEFTEANPIAGEIHGFKLHSGENSFFASFMFFVYMWAFLSFLYIYVRRIIYEERHLFALIAYAILYATVLGTDFINNLGFYLGKVIYG